MADLTLCHARDRVPDLAIADNVAGLQRQLLTANFVSDLETRSAAFAPPAPSPPDRAVSNAAHLARVGGSDG